MEYLTMICDLKNSRQIKNREALQYKLIELLKTANEKYKDYLVASFIITLGDEWQGLLKMDAPYEEIISFFKQGLPEDINFYTGIGIGSITIHNFELTVNQLDGPSFYLAREAIVYAKRLGHRLVILAD
nr:SatD family protein [uncultured Niameybacter sp.]